MKTLEIEWRHLDIDGNTCLRCSDTGEALNKVIAGLADECEPCGWAITFTETRLSVNELQESNMILFNGKPIETILPDAIASESHCESCCEFTGNLSTACRTVEFGGISYEKIPASLIRLSACAIAQCC